MGRHGRDSHALVPGCALMFSLLTALQIGAPPPRQADLARELAAKIAAAVGAAQPVQVVAAGEDTPEGISPAQIRTQVAQALAGRGVSVVDRADGAATATIACSQNLRERTCTAELRKGAASEILIAIQPRDAGVPPDRATPLALELRFIFGQRAPILDVAAMGDRLLVLDETALTLYQRAGNGWQPRRSQRLSSSRVWPRDSRGRLRIDGTGIDVFAPGVTCRATTDSFTLTCADENQAWPIGVENTGVMPARNYFTTPEGLIFYGAAALAPEADARWVLVSQDGRLMLLDAERHPADGVYRPFEPATIVSDVASLNVADPCAAGAYVIVSSRSSTADGAETVRLFRVIARHLIPVTLPVVLSGPLTALWAAPGASSATAVIRNTATGRYEAFQIDASCDR